VSSANSRDYYSLSCFLSKISTLSKTLLSLECSKTTYGEPKSAGVVPVVGHGRTVRRAHAIGVAAPCAATENRELPDEGPSDYSPKTCRNCHTSHDTIPTHYLPCHTLHRERHCHGSHNCLEYCIIIPHGVVLGYGSVPNGLRSASNLHNCRQ